MDIYPVGNTPLTGVWVARYFDGSGIVAFPTEVQALRYAVERQMEVAFVAWGNDLQRGNDGDGRHVVPWQAATEGAS